MKKTDAVRLAAKQAKSTLLRSFLCVLSVAVGVTAMMLIVSATFFAQEKIRDAVKSLGVSGLTVYVDKKGGGASLSAKQAQAVALEMPDVETAMAVKVASGRYSLGQRDGNVLCFGVNEHLGEIISLDVVAGKLFSEKDVQSMDKVTVISEQMAQEIYHRSNIIGKKIRLHVDGADGVYRIVGVVRSQTGALSGAFGVAVPTIVYVPYHFMATEEDPADQLFIQCAAQTDMDVVSSRVITYLQERRQVGGKLAVQNIGGTLESMNRMVDYTAIAFSVIACISFFLAMLGVCSSLLAAADERRQQIGLYLAIGARRKDIGQIFLFQAMLLCLLGGVIGSVVGMMVLHIAALQIPMLSSLRTGLSWIVFSAAALAGGVICGLLPAVRASRLNPIDTM